MQFDRKGSFLEGTVGGIFKRAGFKVELNSKKYGFESDVIARYKNFSIIVECKDYNTYLNIPSLIHQWDSKKRKSRADRVILVIVGIKNIPEKARILAKELDIILWGRKKIDSLQHIGDVDKLRYEINKILKFNEEELIEKSKEDNKKYLKKLALLGIGVIIAIIIFNSLPVEGKIIIGAILFVVFFVWLMSDPKRAREINRIMYNLERNLNQHPQRRRRKSRGSRRK